MDHMDANRILTPIWFAAVFAAIICFLCSRVLRTGTEEAVAGGGNDGAPSSTVAGATAIQMAPPVRTTEPPLLCTYRKRDGWPEGTCGVCLVELDDGEAVRVLPACMHYFHAGCVGEWLRVHATCPLCRAPLVATTSAAEDGKAVSASTNAPAEADPTSAPLPDGLQQLRPRTQNPNPRYYGPAWRNV